MVENNKPIGAKEGIKKYLPGIRRFVSDYERDLTSFGGIVVILALLLLFSTTYKNMIIGIAGLVIIELISDTIKFIWHKPRPNRVSYSNSIEKIYAGSFPSVHAARSAFIYPLFYSTIQSPLAWIFLLMPVIIAYSRLRLKKHDIVDVSFGLILGIGLFFVVKVIMP
jgi:membrane-associated phospholipid phosphatase